MSWIRLKEQSAELAANESRAIHIATHDALTEAPNRLAFQRALGERAKQPGLFAVAMVDLDRFKLVNDTLGHLAGDELIREICAILQRAAPEEALVARLGGDEFAAYTLEVTSSDAILNRIKGKIEVFNCSLSRPYQVAFSTGVVQCDPQSNMTLGDYLLIADTQMYAQKNKRRQYMPTNFEEFQQGKSR